MSRKIRLAVFDLAGTVVDHGSCAPAGAFVRLFELHGIEASVKQAREPMGMHKRDHIKSMLAMPEIAAQWQNVKGAVHTEADIDALFNQFIPLQLECLPDYSRMIEGADIAAALLRARGIKIAATTGYNREMMDIVLNALEKQGLTFDVTCCASEVAGGRPAPWMIYRCMETAGVYPASSVINFGDTVADAASGRNAGAYSVGFIKSGNMLGLTEREVAKIPEDELDCMLAKAAFKLMENGAHTVCDDVTGVMSALGQAEDGND